MERDPIVEALRQYFAGRTDVVAAYLFGSVARGQGRSSSDVDVGVLLRRDRRSDLQLHAELAHLQADLQETLHLPVDVVAMNGAPADLLHRILRDGIRVHDSDTSARVAFELQARMEYFDLLPVLQRYRRTVLGRL